MTNPFDHIETRLQRIEQLLLESKPEPIQPATTGKELKTRKQAATFLGITLPTLHKWTLTGKVKGRRIGSRVRYYQSDLEKALQAIKTQ